MADTTDRMPPIPREQMTEAQRAAADELIAGPRKGVKGPFIPLLRSPELMARLQKVGEYPALRSALPPRLSEFATVLVTRRWTQQFEWAVHVPLAIAAGTLPATIDALRAGIRPVTMSDDEALLHDFVAELVDRGRVRRALPRRGEPAGRARRARPDRPDRLLHHHLDGAQRRAHARRRGRRRGAAADRAATAAQASIAP